MIPQEEIDQLGGDWAGYGEVVGPALMQLIQDGRLSILFAGEAVIVAIQRADGTNGRYNLKHTDLADF